MQQRQAPCCSDMRSKQAWKVPYTNGTRSAVPVAGASQLSTSSKGVAFLLNSLLSAGTKSTELMLPTVLLEKFRPIPFELHLGTRGLRFPVVLFAQASLRPEAVTCEADAKLEEVGRRRGL
ncbi:hypothetical protein CB1_001616096 [Camelus ferus]|nr:hypothetical protein CB1_001616096 [Camelus ferus]